VCPSHHQRALSNQRTTFGGAEGAEGPPDLQGGPFARDDTPDTFWVPITIGTGKIYRNLLINHAVRSPAAQSGKH